MGVEAVAKRRPDCYPACLSSLVDVGATYISSSETESVDTDWQMSKTGISNLQKVHER